MSRYFDLRETPPSITDHAVKRWRQRSDVSESVTVREAWRDSVFVRADGYWNAEDVRYYAPGGAVLLISDDVVVTVLNEDDLSDAQLATLPNGGASR